MIKDSEIGLGIDITDTYQNSVLQCTAKYNSSRFDGSKRWSERVADDDGDYEGSQVYDFFGPSSFFPISVPLSFTPNTRSSLARIWVLGMALPDS